MNVIDQAAVDTAQQNALKQCVLLDYVIHTFETRLPLLSEATEASLPNGRYAHEITLTPRQLDALGKDNRLRTALQLLSSDLAHVDPAMKETAGSLYAFYDDLILRRVQGSMDQFTSEPTKRFAENIAVTLQAEEFPKETIQRMQDIRSRLFLSLPQDARRFVLVQNLATGNIPSEKMLDQLQKRDYPLDVFEKAAACCLIDVVSKHLQRHIPATRDTAAHSR